MTVAGIDFETASVLDVRRVGAEVYARHPSTRVLCAVVGFATGPGAPVTCIRWTPGKPAPSRLVAHIAAGHNVVAHNAAFERAVIRHVLRPQHRWPTVPRSQWLDTAVLASAVGLPPALDALANVLGTDARKDMDGKALMERLCRAVEIEGTYQYPPVSSTDLQRLLEYCEDDVRAMLACLWRLPRLSAFERKLVLVDQKINERGVCVDVTLARRLSALARRRKAELSGDVMALTGDLLSVAAAPLKRWLASQNVEMPTRVKRVDGVRIETPVLDAAALEDLVDDVRLPDDVRDVLRLRMEYGKEASLAKAARVNELVDATGRLYGALRVYGAHTGRWTSSGLQIHNMPRVRDDAVKKRLDERVNAALHGDIAPLARVAPTPMQGLSMLLRSMLVAAPGHDMIGADYSAIEARIVAWLAGQQDVLDAFRARQDVYVRSAKASGSDNRQLGKVQVLALGFGMGAARFAATAAGYGIVLSLKEARRLQKAWRAANANIVALWAHLEDACHRAVREPGTMHKAGPHLKVAATKSALRIYLPSGRALHYWQPKLRTGVKRIQTVNDAGEIVERDIEMTELRYRRARGTDMTIDHTYGGKLVENATQAVARELLAHALVYLDDTPYNVVAHIHDSIVAEVPEGTGDVAEFCGLIEDLPEWADGLPIAAEGYRSKRFRG